MRSIMGGKSKKLIQVRFRSEVYLWILPLRGGWFLKSLARETTTILAHNDDKRKQILFVTGSNCEPACDSDRKWRLGHRSGVR